MVVPLFFCSCGMFFSHGKYFSHGMHGIHGNAVAASACHSELVSPTNFTNVYRYAIGFISHRLHRFKRFFILIMQFAFLLRKNRSMDLHRFLSLRDGFSRCSRGARTLRCSRFCCSLFFFRISFLSRIIFFSRNVRNARKFIAVRCFFYSRKARLHQWENGIMAWAAWVRWVMSCCGLLSSESSKWCSVSHCFILRSSMAGWSAG